MYQYNFVFLILTLCFKFFSGAANLYTPHHQRFDPFWKYGKCSYTCTKRLTKFDVKIMRCPHNVFMVCPRTFTKYYLKKQKCVKCCAGFSKVDLGICKYKDCFLHCKGTKHEISEEKDSQLH
ncbi:uncharacterized protein LOC128248071 [Octopus bimaculoides]|uniref:uncharacterized protein LOC128248071 n=1 Tax=Octopus bimaculoides TaxID=37653 RepID=UPI0022E86502|nr:uncharacterized protein LOC128248071 [Octopus bimaculoides]